MNTLPLTEQLDYSKYRVQHDILQKARNNGDYGNAWDDYQAQNFGIEYFEKNYIMHKYAEQFGKTIFQDFLDNMYTYIIDDIISERLPHPKNQKEEIGGIQSLQLKTIKHFKKTFDEVIKYAQIEDGFFDELLAKLNDDLELHQVESNSKKLNKEPYPIKLSTSEIEPLWGWYSDENLNVKREIELIKLFEFLGDDARETYDFFIVLKANNKYILINNIDQFQALCNLGYTQIECLCYGDLVSSSSIHHLRNIYRRETLTPFGRKCQIFVFGRIYSLLARYKYDIDLFKQLNLITGVNESACKDIYSNFSDEQLESRLFVYIRSLKNINPIYTNEENRKELFQKLEGTITIEKFDFNEFFMNGKLFILDREWQVEALTHYFNNSHESRLIELHVRSNKVERFVVLTPINHNHTVIIDFLKEPLSEKIVC